jgi:hypothetical protein
MRVRCGAPRASRFRSVCVCLQVLVRSFAIAVVYTLHAPSVGISPLNKHLTLGRCGACNSEGSATRCNVSTRRVRDWDDGDDAHALLLESRNRTSGVEQLRARGGWSRPHDGIVRAFAQAARVNLVESDDSAEPRTQACSEPMSCSHSQTLILVMI